MKGKSIEEIYWGISEQLSKVHDCIVTSFYYNNKASILSNILNLYKVKADIYHLTGDVHFLVLFLFKRKVVNTIQDIGSYKNYSGIKKWIYGKLWISLPCAFATTNVVSSKFTGSDLDKYFGIQNLKVINHPISVLFKYSPQKENNKEPIILQVGTAPHKNLKTVIKAIKDIPCKLIIVGKLDRDHKQSLVSNGIKFENYFDVPYQDVVSFYKKSDILAFVSTHEGFGMPIIEANAIGLPIVSSNVCSLPEVAGNSAIFVNPNDVKAIQDAILNIIKDEQLRMELIEKGLINAKRFSIENISAQHYKLYKSLI